LGVIGGLLATNLEGVNGSHNGPTDREEGDDSKEEAQGKGCIGAEGVIHADPDTEEAEEGAGYENDAQEWGSGDEHRFPVVMLVGWIQLAYLNPLHAYFSW
jgi:hypothetical protein